jgi:hypothetical protein
LDEDVSYPIEQAIVVTYEDGRTLAYRTQSERDYGEYHEGRGVKSWRSGGDGRPILRYDAKC